MNTMYDRYLKASRWLAVCLALLIGLSGLTLSASIVFKEFRATQQPNGSILVEWVTGAELDSAAFNLYRATEAVVPLDAAHLIYQTPAEGSDTGAAYQYLDTDTQPGQCYHYLVAELTSSANIGAQAGPIRAGDNCSAGAKTYLPLILR